MANYLLGSGTVPEKLAIVSLSDWIGDGGMEITAVVPDEAAEWLQPVIDTLELTSTPFVPTFSSTDTIVAPADAEGLEDILRTGAVVLDLSDGLVPLELVEDSEVPELPDIPEDLQPEEETPVLEAPPKARRKTSLPPAAGTDEDKPAKKAPAKRASRKKTAPAEKTPAPVEEPVAEEPAEVEEKSQSEVEVATPEDKPEAQVEIKVQPGSAWKYDSQAVVAAGPITASTYAVSVQQQLAGLVSAMLARADEAALWRVLDALRSEEGR